MGDVPVVNGPTVWQNTVLVLRVFDIGWSVLEYERLTENVKTEKLICQITFKFCSFIRAASGQLH